MLKANGLISGREHAFLMPPLCDGEIVTSPRFRPAQVGATTSELASDQTGPKYQRQYSRKRNAGRGRDVRQRPSACPKIEVAPAHERCGHGLALANLAVNSRTDMWYVRMQMQMNIQTLYFHGFHQLFPLLGPASPAPAAAPLAPLGTSPSFLRFIRSGTGLTIVGAAFDGVLGGVPAASLAARLALTSLTRCCIRAASDDCRLRQVSLRSHPAPADRQPSSSVRDRPCICGD